MQSRCCTRGVTGRDRPHRARRARLFAIPASGINSRENRANNDACEHTSRYAVPERNCEYDLEIARHKAGKGGTGFDSTRLTSPRLASPRGYEPSSICLPGPMPAICWGCTTALYASAPSSRRVAVPPNGPFVFISVQRTNLPFSRRYRDRLSLSLFPSLSFFLLLSLFLLHFRRLLLQPIRSSPVSPLSRKPVPTLFSFLHFPQTRVTSIFLHSRVDGFGRVKEPPLPR